MSVRQAKCQHCNLPTGESYDDQAPTAVQSLCAGCRAAAASGAADTPIDRGAWTPGVQPPPAIRTREYGEGENPGACRDCGGTEYELEAVYREYSQVTTTADDGEDYLYFDGSGVCQGYGETEAEGSPYCVNCGSAWRGDWELS